MWAPQSHTTTAILLCFLFAWKRIIPTDSRPCPKTHDRSAPLSLSLHKIPRFLQLGLAWNQRLPYTSEWFQLNQVYRPTELFRLIFTTDCLNFVVLGFYGFWCLIWVWVSRSCVSWQFFGNLAWFVLRRLCICVYVDVRELFSFLFWFYCIWNLNFDWFFSLVSLNFLGLCFVQNCLSVFSGIGFLWVLVFDLGLINLILSLDSVDNFVVWIESGLICIAVVVYRCFCRCLENVLIGFSVSGTWSLIGF